MLSYFKGSNDPPNIFYKHHIWILYIYLAICIHGLLMNIFLVSTNVRCILEHQKIVLCTYSHMSVTIERNTFQVWMVNYRLDFTASIKIFFSLESLFRIILCGFTQPLKLAFFLYGWQPAFLIHATKYFGDIMIGNFFTSSEISPEKEEWMNKKLLCSLPVHLDMTVLFGIAIFIVVCNAAR